MTSLEIYAFAAPAVLFVVCGLAVWWQMHH